MTNKTDEPGPKRPHATIEGKATEVKPEPVGPQPAAAGAAPDSKTLDPKAPASSKATDPKAATPKASDAPKTSAAQPAAGSGAASAGNKPGGAASSSSSPPTSASRPSGAGRMMSNAVSAVIGGLVVLLAAPYVPAFQSMLGAPATSPSPEVAKRLAALEQASQKAGQPAVSEELTKRLAGLQEGVDKLRTITPAIQSLGEGQLRLDAETKALKEQLAQRTASGSDAERLARMEERLSALSAAALADPKGAGPIPQLAQITGRIADLETAMTNRLAAVRRDVAADIENRLATTAEAAETARSGTQRLDREVTGLKSEVTRTAERAEQLRVSADRLAETARAAQEEIAGLKTALDALRRETAKPSDVAAAVAPATARLSKLETSVDNVLKAEADRRTTAERIVLSLELGNLKRAMDRGGTYAGELAEVRKVGGNRLDLGVLQRYQSEGVPTTAELMRQFQPLTGAIIDAAAEQQDASVVDRLLSGARTIVRVRKLTPDEGDTSAEAMVARMEGALREGRLGDVLAMSKALPPKAITPAVRDWLDKVAARHAVEAAMTKIDAELKSSLGATPVSAPAKDAKQ